MSRGQVHPRFLPISSSTPQVTAFSTFLARMVWTTDQIPDLTDKVILVTGATSGIGLEAAKVFAHNGAKLVMACRNTDKMAKVAQQFQDEKPSDIVQLKLDTSDLDSVRDFVADFKDTRIPKIDVLLLNAGVNSLHSFTKSKQGVELTFATNHLGHWLLTGMLLDYMASVPDSRIIAVSSLGHKYNNHIDYSVARGNEPSTYAGMVTYCQTKLANQWFVTALNRRLVAAGIQTIAVPAHPGATRTDLNREASSFFNSLFVALIAPLQQTVEQGALPLIMAAVDPLITRNSYYAPSGFFELGGTPKSNGHLSAAVSDQGKDQELWDLSEELTGYKYPI